MNNSTTKLMFSSESNEWATPQTFFNKLDNKFNFTLDPCATKKTAKCNKYYTKNDDGLSKSWEGETVFVNPPYGRELKNWVKKAYDESRNSNTTVVLLCPARTDTKYFHNYMMKASELHFIKGRLKFESDNKKNNSAPFPSVVAVFKSETTPTINSM
jgi:phage N-6-adenine-methyltransferase